MADAADPGLATSPTASADLASRLRATGDWATSRFPGVRYRTLHYDKASGAGAVLIEMAAATTYGTHRHTAGEDVLVLEGELIIGAARYPPASFVHSPAGSVHTPRTDRGCLLYATFPGKIEHL